MITISTISLVAGFAIGICLLIVVAHFVEDFY